jgi:hypothetical protein
MNHYFESMTLYEREPDYRLLINDYRLDSKQVPSKAALSINHLAYIFIDSKAKLLLHEVFPGCCAMPSSY